MSDASAVAARSHPGRQRNIITGIAIAAAMLAAVVALGLVRSTASPTTAAAAPTGGPPAVTIKDFAFAPASLTVKAGTTVVWTNVDSEPHTVRTVSSETVKSGTLETNATYSFTFDKPGTYAYHCSIHTEMHGTITVTS